MARRGVPVLKIFHTSDWHLGAQLHDQSRLPEQEKFLDWLKSRMAQERPDVLIIAGDIFDTCAPSNAALNLYYDFLATTYKENLCRMVVVIGGNHDSPSLLDAPSTALSHLHTRVIGSVKYPDGDILAPGYENEVIVVKDAAGCPGLVIGAVPYLRDADLRSSAAQDTRDDRIEKLKRGFARHYAAVVDLARQQATLPDGRQLPIVLTGHLFLTGGTTAAEKSERDLQIGNLGALEQALLPSADYYALGHLHSPQTISGCETCRYAGAPIPMSFGEARQSKSIVIVEFAPQTPPVVRLDPIPQTQSLVQFNGTPEAIVEKLTELVASGKETWVDLQITEGIGDLTSWWNTFPVLVEGSAVRILRSQNARPGKEPSALGAVIAESTRLEHMTPEQLFGMRLADEDLTDGEKLEFTGLFQEICLQCAESDTNRE